MTTLAVRAQEQAIERRTAQLAQPAGRDVSEIARDDAAREVAERIGGPLSPEQHYALEVLTGPERAAVLVGPAGTGKGVVIDAVARAEQHAGRDTIGVAVSGSTAERLGADSPALAERTLTLDALIARANTGTVYVGRDTTVILDEAGMIDHKRLDALTGLVEHSGAKLIAVGDGKQLPSIGPGGMFDRLADHAPSAELTDIHRTKDLADQRAWQALRAGEPERAMAHYASRGQLHLSDTRDQAAEQAVQTWATLTEGHDIREVALIADAANTEIDRLNARAQHLRAQRGELGYHEIPLPGVHYGLREGDLIAFTAQHRPRGQPRVENGTRGQVTNIHERGVTLTLDGSQRKVQLAGEDLDSLEAGLRAARLPSAGRNRRAHRRTNRRLANQQGDRLRRGHHAHATAPTGSSPATTSAPKDRTPSASRASPNRCATAARRPHRSRIRSAPTPAGRQAAIPYGSAPPSRQHAGSPAHPTATRPTTASVVDAEPPRRLRLALRAIDVRAPAGAAPLCARASATGGRSGTSRAAARRQGRHRRPRCPCRAPGGQTDLLVRS